MNTNDTQISPLRQRLLDDMQLRKLGPKSQSAYIRAIKKLEQFLEHSPHTATAEELRAFQLHMANDGTSRITLNATLTAIRFLFNVTLDHPVSMRGSERVLLMPMQTDCLKASKRLKLLHSLLIVTKMFFIRNFVNPYFSHLQHPGD